MSIKLKIARVIYESDDISPEKKLKLIKEIRKHYEIEEGINEVVAKKIVDQIAHLKRLLKLRPEMARGLGEEIQKLTRRLDSLSLSRLNNISMA
jgi:DNA-directed RNA polymerase subunit F